MSPAGLALAAAGVGLSGRLERVSTIFTPGTLNVICGPNGAGKSSLLQVLAGLLAPEVGTVELGGAPLPTGRARARRLAYLPQGAEIAWDLSVEALARLGRLPHGDRGDAAVCAALSAVDVAHLAQRPVSTLSGGERARVLLARVLAGEPHWILADEPLAALDLGHQLGLLAHLRATAARGAGIVLVLHDLELAMNHADRVVVLDRGRVADEGAPERALGEETIARVWGVKGRWLGEPGAKALAVGEKGSP